LPVCCFPDFFVGGLRVFRVDDSCDNFGFSAYRLL